MLLGGDALGRPVLGQITNPTAAQTPIGWLRPLSEPVRSRLRLREGDQQFLAFNPQPFVSFGWMEPLSEPVRVKPRLRPGAQPAFAMQPMPSPFVASGWFSPLSEPVRPKRRSPAALSPFLSWQPAPSPFVATGWYSALSEPVRLKRGLRTHLQRYYEGPARLMPNPNVTGVMAAVETKDTFLAAASIFNRPVDGELGVQELDRAGEISVSVHAPPVSARMSIRTQ